VEIMAGALNLLFGPASSAPWEGLAEWLNRNTKVIASTQLAGGLLMLVCGAAAWCGRKWAVGGCRVMLYGSGMLMVVWAIAFAVSPPVSVHPLIGGPMRAALLTAGLSYAAPLFVGAWLFGRRDVVAWFDEGPTAGQQRVAADEARAR
jgi:hypothetical protein